MASEIFTNLPRATDADGDVLSGATWSFYASGTSTPQAVYSDAALATSLGPVVTADSGGQFAPIYFNSALSYRGILKTAGGATIYEADPINAGVLASLASTAGAGLSGFSQSTSYSGGTVGRKLQQRVSPLDAPYNATGNAVSDDLTAINSAIVAAANIGEIDLSGATYRVSAAPTNNRGVLPVNGSVVIGTGSAAYQLNSYTRGFDFVHGRGNAYALKNAINTAGTAWNAFIYGDSTVATTANGGIPGGSFTPDVLLAQFMRENGVRNFGTFTNRAVGGTDWADPTPLTDLATTTKLMVFKFGINHVSGQDIDAEISAMRAQLAAVRGAANGGWHQVTILLVGPSATHDTAGGRTSYWYERLRNAYIQAAWDYGCVYVDLYGLFPDATRWAGYYADTPAVHPQALLLQEMWAYVGAAILPPGGLQISTGARWVSPTMQNSWTGYDNGFETLRVSLNADGKVFIVGGATPPGGTITAGQTIAILPNTNYYSARSAILTGWTFNGSAWATIVCGTDTAGNIFARAGATGITALLFEQQCWQTW